VVFLIDAIDRQRFLEAKRELNSLLLNEDLRGVPFLFLGNKINMPSAYAFGLIDTYGKDVSSQFYENDCGASPNRGGLGLI
jgi:GTP-binding protein SAR1